MIKNPIILIAILFSVEFFILFISSRKTFEKYFHFLPSVFWIYFIPMLLSTAGLIDNKSDIYKTITDLLLPMSLVILLLSANIKAILRLGPSALIMMLAGSLGIMVGIPFAFWCVKNLVGSQMWAGFGALSASWTGGSANMIAVKEALNTPDAVFSPMVIVDTIVPYVWMGLLVALVAFQPIYDKWNKSRRDILDELNARIDKTKSNPQRITLLSLCLIIGIGLIGSVIAKFGSNYLPNIKGIISQYTWVIIIASGLGIALSFTPARKLETFHASKIGYYILYFVLTTIGAKASLSNIGSTAILIGAGFIAMFVHLIFLLITARILRAPMFLVATASQANVGGVASAPVVAALYEPELASVGLLLAIFGNIVGTYIGIITGYVCKIIS
ncbi:MAG: DUF819 family protein [Candidatus Omnitrophica bacterium]|nr:DUF819 family protein [Candidatus Omnitrophota bacterium]